MFCIHDDPHTFILILNAGRQSSREIVDGVAKNALAESDYVDARITRESNDVMTLDVDGRGEKMVVVKSYPQKTKGLIWHGQRPDLIVTVPCHDGCNDAALRVEWLNNSCNMASSSITEFKRVEEV